MELDRIDLELVAALQKNARLTNKELAAKVGLAPSTCLERVRTLTREGVLLGFHADVDRTAIGIGLEALVSLRLMKQSRTHFQSLYKHILSLPEVLVVHHVSGIKDLLVHVAVRDVHHLRDFVVERIANRSEVGECETSLIYDTYRAHQLPCYAQPEDRSRRRR